MNAPRADWRALLIVAISGALVACHGGTPTSATPKGLVISSDPPPPVVPASDFLDDELAVCPSADLSASVSDIPVIFPDASGTSGPLVCTAAAGSRDLTAVQLDAYDALIIAKRLQFDQPLPWTSKPLYQWLHDAVAGLRYFGGSSTSFCCSPARMPNIYLGTPHVPLRWTTVIITLAATMHEARHAEGVPHNCGTNDNHLADYGAWGVHNAVFTWIALHSDPAVIPIEFRPYELWLACTQANNVFCLDPPKSCTGF